MSVKSPEVTVTVGGSDLEVALSGVIGKVEVNLLMSDAGSAEIELTEVYDTENQEIHSVLTDGLILGGKVEISMGYSDEKSKVFSGYLDSVELEADGEKDYVLRLKAWDVIHLMKENYNCRIFREKSFSEVFSEVMSSYSWLCTASADDTEVLEEIRTWHQEGSDFDFIVHSLVEHGMDDREFYVCCGSAGYTEPDDTVAESAVLSDQECIRILAAYKYVNQSILVQGYSAGYENYQGEADACMEDLDSTAAKGTAMYLLSEANTQEHVDAIAGRYAKKLLKRGKTVRLFMEGKPAMLVGVYVKLEELDGIWNGKYRIAEAAHRYDENGYQTEILLEG